MLTDQLTSRCYEFQIGSAEVRVQGSLVVADGEPVRLSDRERAVLHALLRKPGAVVSRPELLRTVWGTTDADEHALEVTVARLRRRLGSVGRAIETVVRRGYRIAATARVARRTSSAPVQAAWARSADSKARSRS